MPFHNLKFKIKNLKFFQGFTLIELLVVITVMAVLGAGILYSTNNTREKARDARRKADLRAIASALILWKVDHRTSSYPQTGLYGATPYIQIYQQDGGILEGVINPIYINKIPRDPLTPGVVDYFYVGTPQATQCNDYTVPCTGFEVVGCLENGNDPDRDSPKKGHATPQAIAYIPQINIQLLAQTATINLS